MPTYDVTAPDGKTYEVTAPDGATQEQVLAYAQQKFGRRATDAPQAKPEAKPEVPPGGIPGFSDAVKSAGNLAAGAVRGAGSIGATLLAPIDATARALNDGKPVNIGGYDVVGQDRRAGMDNGLTELGADKNSLAFKTGKLGTEIAGTAGAGGAVANVLSKIPAVATKAPMLLEAIKTGGMSLGGTTGSRLADTALRVSGGAVSGGATAGLVNPEDAGTGAIIGGIAPPIIQAAGAAGKAIGQKAAEKYADELSKFKRAEPMRNTLKESVGAGYVVPPNMVNPSAKNAIVESFSGKQATSQIASVRNQDVTDKLVRQALGLADDVPLTKGTLEQIRTASGGAYKDVARLSPQAELDLEALKQARNESQGWYNAYNRSASPADLSKAKEFRDLAEVLEMQLESHAKAAGKQELIPALRDARKQIAKTYTVERALNDATGTVNAKVLGRLYDKGKPLSGGLDTVGRFASGFPSVAQAPQQMGSPAAHNLRAVTSLMAGGAGVAATGPLGLIAGAIPFVAGPASRSMMFREGAQQALANQAAPTLGKPAQLIALLQNPEIQQMIARSAPVIASPGR